jgi:superfamily II DNA or RNA helicase
LPAAAEVEQATAPVDKTAKVALFRSLFRGREDVYAIRWQMKNGEWGYRPDDKKDWKAVLASKAEDRKKVDRETRTFYPLTDDVVRAHLEGKKTIGLYPLLTDETCWFLAADFDKATWQDDALAFIATCHKLRLPAYLERSRSGNGSHVWIFFEQATPAILARKLGCAVLTQTMERRHHLGLDSYDRFFPNQDTMPKGGFGNLIALPLQWAPRQKDNSVFVDDNLCPYPDQWRLLACVRRVKADDADWIVNEAARHGQLVGVRMSITDDVGVDEPWTLPPSRKVAQPKLTGTGPDAIEIIRGNLIYVPKAGLSESLLNQIIRIAAFQNPEFYKAQAMRLSTWDKPRIISCAEEFPEHVALPRGCLDELTELLEGNGTRVSVRDERFGGKTMALRFLGNLRDEQAAAIREALKHDEGVLCAPTAFGKTVVASKLIAERGVNTLILLHRQQLPDQWRERLSSFLSLPAKEIGHIAGGKDARKGVVDVALIQSLQRKGEVKDLVADYGHVIVDECHHLSAVSFEQVMRQVKAKYILGLTATPTRKDGHQPIIFMQCGPIRFSVSVREAAAQSPFRHVVLPKQTNFRTLVEDSEFTIQDAYAALGSNKERNGQIIADILNSVSQGRTPLVLTGRTEHLEVLAGGLQTIEHVLVMKGGMGKKQRKAAAEKLATIPEGVPRVIIATGSYIGEGFDDPRLDTLFLTMPISWRGTLQQYVGRLHRLHEGKKVVQVYDYVDAGVPMLARMFEKRLKGYHAIGYEMEGASDAVIKRETRGPGNSE